MNEGIAGLYASLRLTAKRLREETAFMRQRCSMRMVWQAAAMTAVFGLGATTGSAQIDMTPGGPLTDQDKAEIRALWSAYRDTFAKCDGEAYANLFATPGGYFASAPRGELREHKVIAEMPMGYDHCKPGYTRPAPRPQAAGSGQARPSFPEPVIEASPEGARARIINSRGGGYYDDVYVKTPTGWKFKSRTVIADNEVALGYTKQDFIEIRELAGDDHGHYEDLYGEIGGDIKPRGMGSSDHFRTSGLRILIAKDSTVTGLAYLRNNGGHYEDVYVKTPQGWRIKERKYFKP
jgi:hypothetical protein